MTVISKHRYYFRARQSQRKFNRMMRRKKLSGRATIYEYRNGPAKYKVEIRGRVPLD